MLAFVYSACLEHRRLVTQLRTAKKIPFLTVAINLMPVPQDICQGKDIALRRIWVEVSGTQIRSLLGLL